MSLKASNNDGDAGSSLVPRFPKATTGYICERCKSIPAELFVFGSQLGSNKCRGRHESDNCKGKHNIICSGCAQDINNEVHYHCRICKDNNYDLCQLCNDAGKTCGIAEHKMRRLHCKDSIITEAPEERTKVAGDEEKDNSRAEAVQRSLEPYLLFSSVRELKASADSGCHFCSALVTRLAAVPPDFVELDPAVLIECKPIAVPESYKFVAYMSARMLEEPDLDFQADWGLPQTVLAFRQRNGDPDQDVLRPLAFKIEGPSGHWLSRDPGFYGAGWLPRQISPVADDLRTLSVVRKWVDACSRDEKCSEWANKPFRPTRLIDVEASGGGSSLRIVEKTSLGETAPEYVVLSYCWGEIERPPWITTKANLKSRTELLPSETLPKTIADAVTVARAVGIRYLWVDSICIVQDDPDEWARETRLLRSVYTAAQFTIVSGTADATSGLFIARDELRVSAADMVATPITDLIEPHRVALFPVLQSFPKIHRGGPTTKRAWCLQEELLSPRRLYFTKHQFIWECVCSSHDETGVWAPGDTVKASEGYSVPPYPTDVLTYPGRVLGEWFRIVEEYTSRSLTHYGDIFAAIAGIAAALKDKYEHVYKAGLWEEDFLPGLLWQRIGCSLERPVEFGAPSWSWLSVKDQVLFNRGSFTWPTTDADFISCDVQTKNDDEFGEIVSGTLRMRARLLVCRVSQDGIENDNYKLYNTDRGLPSKVVPPSEESGAAPWDTRGPSRMVPPGGRMDLTACLESGGLTFATVFFDGDEEARTQEVFCAYVGATGSGKYCDRNGIALVLVSVKDDVAIYRRVGFVAFWDKLIKDRVDSLLDTAHTELILV